MIISCKVRNIAFKDAKFVNLTPRVVGFIRFCQMNHITRRLTA